ncbi:uncharacterized protein LOC111356328 [Spodoptera litura]|uniref:Uncharacterized protein LOC111356328 n=1 Tax=Spodoptera litura TaxID=69820 RepID=A0A9J7IX20_SPOLT|nr:uncharacterized protein LOC111356328 [Spodoptera litura]
MDSNKKKYERFRYTQETLERAVTAIAKGEITINKASNVFSIPKSTLHNKLTNKVPLQRKMGPPSELTVDEEAKIAEWIVNKAKLGFPMHPEEVFDTVENFLTANNRKSKFTGNRPGKKWLKLFLNRHPEITKRNAEVISKGRAAVTESAIRAWFKELDQFLIEEDALDIKNNPSRIFNADETGVMTCPKTGIILGPKNYRNTYEIASGKEKESITVLCTFAADGKDVPPFVVYPYKRMPPAVIQNFPDSWYIGRSDSGWMVSNTFFSYIKLFYDWLVQNEIQLPVILFLDGHKSHINQEMFEFCRVKLIFIYCLYPNATHILQPCDVAIFGPLKKSWRKVERKNKQSSTPSITKQNFAKKFQEAYTAGLKVETIKNAFRACGLFPMNADAVNYSKCISTRREEINEQSLRNQQNEILEERRNNMRSAIKVIETEVGQTLRNEFVQTYVLKQMHQHPYFSLWVKCRKVIDGTRDTTIATNTSSDVPLDLSNTSSSFRPSLTDINGDLPQESIEPESNSEIVIQVADKQNNDVVDNNQNIDLIVPTTTDLIDLNNITNFSEYFRESTWNFNETSDIVDLIIDSDLNLPTVIPLPWYDTPLPGTISENTGIIETTTVCPESSLSDAFSTPFAPEIFTEEHPEIDNNIPAMGECVINEEETQQGMDTNKIETFLSLPRITSKKKTYTKKSNPMPFGLTGQRYKKHIEIIEEEKRTKEEEKKNEKKRKLETWLDLIS